MITLNQSKPKILLVDSSLSGHFIEAVNKATELLHFRDALAGIESARNTIEPDGIIVDLRIDSNKSSLRPPFFGFWVVEQLRDIPVCFNIPIAVVSEMDTEELRAVVARINDGPPLCRHFHTEEVVAIIDYISEGELPVHELVT